MKVALLSLSLVACCLASCTTIQNRRDMYCGYGHVCGPYTCGIYKETETIVITETAADYKSVTK